MSHLIAKYWAAAKLRGEVLQPVYAMVSNGGEQPAGYVLGWSVNKCEIERRAAERGCAVTKMLPEG